MDDAVLLKRFLEAFVGEIYEFFNRYRITLTVAVIHELNYNSTALFNIAYLQ